VPGGEHLGSYLQKNVYSDTPTGKGPGIILHLAVELAYAPVKFSQPNVNVLASGYYFIGTCKYTVRLSQKKKKTRETSFESLPVGSILVHNESTLFPAYDIVLNGVLQSRAPLS
jgi:hypothetical protein